MIEQVLIEWVTLPSEDQSWEDLEAIKSLIPNTNLEDILYTIWSGDVKIELDIKVGQHLRSNLCLDNQDFNEPLPWKRNPVR